MNAAGGRFPFGVASTDLTLPGPCIARPSPEAPSSPFAWDTFLPDCDIRRQGDESGPDPTEVSSSEFLYPSAFETSQPSPCSQNRSLEFVSVEQACRSGVSTKRRRLREVSCFMRAAGFLVGSTLFLMGCSQAIDYTYSKRNFTNSTFEADLSACRRAQPDDAMVRQIPYRPGSQRSTPWHALQAGSHERIVRRRAQSAEVPTPRPSASFMGTQLREWKS